MFTDISEQKEAEEALRDRERTLRLVMNTIPALVAYIGPDFRYLRVNKGYEDWFRRPAGEIEAGTSARYSGQSLGACQAVHGGGDGRQRDQVRTVDALYGYRAAMGADDLCPDYDEEGNVSGSWHT